MAIVRKPIGQGYLHVQHKNPDRIKRSNWREFPSIARGLPYNELGTEQNGDLDAPRVGLRGPPKIAKPAGAYW